MLLDVKPILHTPGGCLDFQFTLDLSDVEFSGRYPVSRPVSVSGEVRNAADVLYLDLTARTTLDAVCDRCGKEFPLDREISYHCMLAESLENGESDEIELLEDGRADLGELARIAFILGMDTKILCSEDCKGLCSRCGADLNLGPCSCKKEIDPRLAALAKLLENK
nr:DUF177 domain-containing protein [uncultured Oscillibacter sp.]